MRSRSKRKVIEVGTMESATAHSPDILYSGGIGPCIAIAIYDPYSKIGHMMHSPDFELVNLKEDIEKIVQQSKDPSSLKVYAIGNSLDSEDDEELQNFVLNNRILVEKTLKEIFGEHQLEIFWAPSDHICTLTLDILRGEFSTTINQVLNFMDDEDEE